MNRRLPLALVLIAAIVPPGHARAADTPPTAPLIRDARVYSPTAGEIFWQRSTDDRGVRGYEVKRDARVLGVFDALSLFDDTLNPRTVYAYCVAAIDTGGQRTSAGCTTLVTPDDGASGRDGPRPVTGLRGRIYSRTAAGIAWERQSAIGTRYEIRRDGEALFVTDGGSYLPSDLLPGRETVVEIVTIDPSGERSAPATIRLATEPPSVVVETDEPPPSGDGPDAPRDVRITVYSATAAELFWTRPPSRERVIGTEVRRDGELLATAPGPSFFDDTRAPGRRYAYELTAVAADGTRSAPGGLVEDGVGPDASIDSANWEAVLRSLVPMIGVVPLEAVRDEIDPFAESLASAAFEAFLTGSGSAVGATFVSTGGMDANVFEDRYDFVCEAGGSLAVNLRSGPQSLFVDDVVFADCLLEDGLLRDGAYIDLVSGRAGGTYTELDYHRRDPSEAGGAVRLAGTRRFVPSRGLPRGTFGWYGVDYVDDALEIAGRKIEWRRERYPADDGPLGLAVTLPDGTTARVTGGAPDYPSIDRISLDGELTVRSPASAGGPLDVTVALSREGRLLDFAPGEDPGYPIGDLGPVIEATADDGTPVTLDLRSPDTIDGWAAGELVVRAADGSTLTLTPVAGDAGRFAVRLSATGETFVRAWADGFDPRCPGPLFCD